MNGATPALVEEAVIGGAHTLTRSGQPAKAPSPICVTDSGMVTEVRDAQREKA